jgi:hypothetical protein
MKGNMTPSEFVLDGFAQKVEGLALTSLSPRSGPPSLVRRLEALSTSCAKLCWN